MLQLRTRTDEDHILHQAHPGPDLSTEITLNYSSGTNGVSSVHHMVMSSLMKFGDYTVQLLQD